MGALWEEGEEEGGGDKKTALSASPLTGDRLPASNWPSQWCLYSKMFSRAISSSSGSVGPRIALDKDLSWWRWELLMEGG